MAVLTLASFSGGRTRPSARWFRHPADHFPLFFLLLAFRLASLRSASAESRINGWLQASRAQRSRAQPPRSTARQRGSGDTFRRQAWGFLMRPYNHFICRAPIQAGLFFFALPDIETAAHPQSTGQAGPMAGVGSSVFLAVAPPRAASTRIGPLQQQSLLNWLATSCGLVVSHRCFEPPDPGRPAARCSAPPRAPSPPRLARHGRRASCAAGAWAEQTLGPARCRAAGAPDRPAGLSPDTLSPSGSPARAASITARAGGVSNAAICISAY